MEMFSLEVDLSAGAESVDLDEEKSITSFRPKAEEELCKAITSQYQAALVHTADILCGGSNSKGQKRLDVVLQDCADQLHGVRDQATKALEEHFGVSYHTNFTALKVSTVCNWLQEALQDSDGLPVTLTPSPIPSLNATMLFEVANAGIKPAVQALEVGLLQGNGGLGLTPTQALTIEDETLKMTAKAKGLILDASVKLAEDAAKKHEKLIKDQMFDGGYNEAMINFLHDLALYPFACMSGPKNVVINTPVWKKDKFVDEERVVAEFKAISPHDVCWSEDCTDGQNGTAVYYRHRVGYNDLKRAATLESYIEKNVKDLLTAWREGDISPQWARYADDSKRSGEGTSEDMTAVVDAWEFKVGSTIEVVTRYGLMMGEDMKTLGVVDADKLESDVMYETTLSFVDEYVIQAFISPNIGSRKRPLHFASYEAMKDRIPGVSVAMKIRDLEMGYNALQRIALYNVSRSSSPQEWVDSTRVDGGIASDEQGAFLDPGKLLVVNSNGFTSQGAPYGVVPIPNNTGAIQAYMQYLTQMIDVISGVPESLHGQPVGTGANRTVSGMFNLQANATKAIQQALNNIDRCVVGPIGQMLYYYNMEYSDDDSIKGDAKVSSVYGKNMLQSEIKKQKSMEAFQLATQGAAAMQNNPVFMQMYQQIFVDLFKGLGYDLDTEGAQTAPPMTPEQPSADGQHAPTAQPPQPL
jgi:hypothetical protein